MEDGEVLLDASVGSYPTDGVCLGYRAADFLPDLSYSISATFKSVQPDNEVHVGIAYNLVDEDNFDSVFVRSHRDSLLCTKILGGVYNTDVQSCMSLRPESTRRSGQP